MRKKDLRAPFEGLAGIDWEKSFGTIPTPSYILDKKQLQKNGEILLKLQKRTGCRILLAQKAFSCYDTYPLLSRYAAGTEASGLYEARLGAEKMPGKEVHVFCGAYREEEFRELLRFADHIVFNTPGQLRKFGPSAKRAGKSLGLRINPECSTQEGHDIYDPCAPGSRLGTTRELWEEEMTEELAGLLDGLHFHTLCEQDSDDLKVTLQAFCGKFSDVLPRMKCLNMGGGHHITRPGYRMDILEKCISDVQRDFGLTVYLEPGEAWALNAGYLVTRVLDTFHNKETRIAILDASAACHMPDVLEMPYQPPLFGARVPEEADQDALPFRVRLGGPTCLSGDIIGEYCFPEPPEEGKLLCFGDMAIYTICKNNTFNGMPLPQIRLLQEDGSLTLLASFGYEDFLQRLGGSAPDVSEKRNGGISEIISI
ncbi:MAG: carboxynorspermidine decarboxylase [Blautia sp.]|nr:carboxynorspermidine decarboxylase [Blautia sp.]